MWTPDISFLLVILWYISGVISTFLWFWIDETVNEFRVSDLLLCLVLGFVGLLLFIAFICMYLSLNETVLFRKRK